ncbi:MAG TPA: hypothetical protein VM755_17755 [Stellaceae bacterium]|nr:hypothetical protein [Stellaceae bacterium]
MTLHEVEELFAYWAAHPPLHLMVAACLGIRPGKRAPGVSGEAALLAQLGAGFVKGDVHRGLPPAILDFAELLRRAAEQH